MPASPSPQNGAPSEAHEPALVKLGAPVPPSHCLIAFEAIARHHGIASAARELGVTRSALSHSINLLEHRLQVRLFRQTHPSVELTRAGTLYLGAVQDLARTLGDSLYRLSDEARTTLRLAVCPAMARLWLAGRLPRFCEKHTRIDLNVTLTHGDPGNVLDHADVALCYGAQSDSELLAVPLWRETLVPLAVPALASKAVLLDPQELLQRFALVEVSQFSWETWMPGQVARRAVARSPLVTPDLVYGLEMAAAGAGIVLAPRRLAGRYIESGKLAPASTFLVAGSYYHAVTLETSASRAPVAAFLGWLTVAVHESPTAGVIVR